ncbi:hypothetical protein ACTQ3J_06465 [Oscillospiraceae bacterium LCP25S3_E3]
MISRRRFMGRSQQSLYTELEYIESTGTQYIDTKYICSNDTKIEIDFAIGSFDTRNALFGIIDSSVGANSYFYSWINNKKLQLRFGQFGKTMSTELEIGQRYVLIQGKQKASVNDVELGGWSNTLTKAANSIFLMALRNNTVASYQFKGRIYGFKIYENDILVMDLIPVFDNKIGVACMYDKISNEFLYNKGTGKFLYEYKQ